MGSAINIVNPIMKKAWVRSLGTDEINNNHINGNILAETLYAMLKEGKANSAFRKFYEWTLDTGKTAKVYKGTTTLV